MKFSRRQKTIAAILCASVYIIPIVTIDGALDLFLKTKDGAITKGTSDDSEYPDSIEIDTFAFGGGVAVSSFTGGTSNREVSAPNLSEITISKIVDQTSPSFFGAMVQGTNITQMELILRKTSSYSIIITLDDVIVASNAWSGSDASDNLIESISLAYAKIRIQYYSFDEKGGKTQVDDVEYDLKTGKAT